MTNKPKNVATLAALLCTAIALTLLLIFGIGKNQTFGISNIKQGLDLKGGVSIVYEAEAENPTPDEMASAISLIRGRLDRMGSTEADVSQQGAKRITIDIPGVYDAEEAIKQFGQTAKLTFEDDDGNLIVDGTEVVSAKREAKSTQLNGLEYFISLEFNSAATARFAEATARLINKPIHIKLDGETISSPIVSVAITDGKCVIEGNYTAESANEFAALIRAGALPFNLTVINMNNVGAKLGADSLETSLIAGAIGSAMVVVFMLLIYRIAGLAANLALLFYLLLELLLLSTFNITLTLPGIAGIILSVGMAVDANIIIFERLKDELKTGRALRHSIKIAFSKSFSAILDGNITTLIAAAVLFWLGTGPVKGFAQTLSIGIMVSMFSALVITRLILTCFSNLGLTSTGYYLSKKTRQIKLPDIIKHRAKYLAVSLIIIVIGIASAIFNVTQGKSILNFDVEFTGGTSLHLNIGQDFENDDIAAIITEVTGQSSPQIQKILNKNEVMIKIKSIEQDMRITLVEAIAKKYSLTTDDLIITVGDTSATVSGEMQRTAILAVAVACLAILVYISIRFKNITAGTSAVIALIHDALIMLCAYSVLRINANYSFIAAFLTVIGYSINATIVMFDRVRENEKLNEITDRAELINLSVRQTLTRSVYTSLTTMFTITALYIVGVQSIKEFALPIIVGILSGTYSSVFLAGSIWHLLDSKKGKNQQNGEPDVK